MISPISPSESSIKANPVINEPNNSNVRTSSKGTPFFIIDTTFCIYEIANSNFLSFKASEYYVINVSIASLYFSFFFRSLQGGNN